MNKQSKSESLSILFLSCDSYQDLWKPLFYCVHKYFKQSNYPMFLGSNTISIDDRKIKTLFSGEDRDWSTSLLAILKQITTPYVFIWLDDMFPIEPVDENRFEEAIQFMKKTNAKHMHMSPLPKPDTLTGVFGIYERGAPYRVNALGFWNVEYLKDLLVSGENPWNFEIMGSYRSKYDEGFYCVMKPLFNKLHVVEKGQIFSNAYVYCKKHNIPLVESKRKVMKNSYEIRSVLQKLYFNLIIRIPWKTRVSLMNLLRKLLISY